MSGKGSRIPYSKTYFATGLCSELTLKGALKEFLRSKPRLITNPSAADESAIPTAPNNNLFSPKNDIILLAQFSIIFRKPDLLLAGGLGKRLPQARALLEFNFCLAYAWRAGFAQDSRRIQDSAGGKILLSCRQCK